MTTTDDETPIAALIPIAHAQSCLAATLIKLLLAGGVHNSSEIHLPGGRNRICESIGAKN